MRGISTGCPHSGGASQRGMGEPRREVCLVCLLPGKDPYHHRSAVHGSPGNAGHNWTPTNIVEMVRQQELLCIMATKQSAFWTTVQQSCRSDPAICVHRDASD